MKSALLTLAAVACGATALAAGAARAPDALRGVDEFRIANVVVHGATLLDPADVLQASGIGPASSVFDDAESWRGALLAHPLIVDVRIERELPGTIELFIEESTPVAYAPTPELRPVDARGYVLPVRRGAAALDLPVLDARTQVGTLSDAAAADGRSFTRITDEASLRAIAVIATIARLDPAFEAMISEAAPLRGGDVRLTMRQPAGTLVLLAGAVVDEQLRAVRLTLAHLGKAAAGAQIDARYHEQVVVKPAAASGTRVLPGGAR